MENPNENEGPKQTVKVRGLFFGEGGKIFKMP